MNKAVGERKTGYCAAAGVPELRSALGKAMGAARGGMYPRHPFNHFKYMNIYLFAE